VHINKLFINFKFSPSIQRIYIKFHNINSFLGLAAAETLTLKDFASGHVRVITRLEEEEKKKKKKEKRKTLIKQNLEWQSKWARRVGKQQRRTAIDHLQRLAVAPKMRL
jgi:hypothetical protein